MRNIYKFMILYDIDALEKTNVNENFKTRIVLIVYENLFYF